MNEWTEDERVIEAATPEPWTISGNGVRPTIDGPESRKRYHSLWSEEIFSIEGELQVPQTTADATFVTRARTRWSAWIERCKAAEALLNEVYVHYPEWQYDIDQHFDKYEEGANGD